MVNSSSKWNFLFRLIMGVTGVAESILGASIVLFAVPLQTWIAPGILSEPLYLRILGMMDLWIGLCYFQIGRQPDRWRQLNQSTAYLRLGLCCVFLVEGVWLLDEPLLRWAYQLLALFDFSLFLIQTLYLRKTRA